MECPKCQIPLEVIISHPVESIERKELVFGIFPMTFIEGFLVPTVRDYSCAKCGYEKQEKKYS